MLVCAKLCYTPWLKSISIETFRTKNQEPRHFNFNGNFNQLFGRPARLSEAGGAQGDGNQNDRSQKLKNLVPLRLCEKRIVQSSEYQVVRFLEPRAMTFQLQSKLNFSPGRCCHRRFMAEAIPAKR